MSLLRKNALTFYIFKVSESNFIMMLVERIFNVRKKGMNQRRLNAKAKKSKIIEEKKVNRRK